MPNWAAWIFTAAGVVTVIGGGGATLGYLRRHKHAVRVQWVSDQLDWL